MEKITIRSRYASENDDYNVKVYLSGYYAGYDLGKEPHAEPFNDGVMTELVEVVVPSLCFGATYEEIEADWRRLT